MVHVTVQMFTVSVQRNCTWVTKILMAPSWIWQTERQTGRTFLKI